MSRKDTILIAVLINCALLVVLFMMAIHTDQDSRIVVVEEPSGIATIPPVEREIPKPSPTVLTQVDTGDELDQVLQNYTGSTTTATTTTNNKPVQESKENFVEITVKYGDYLEKIARANGTTVNAIMQANHLPSIRIDVGQVLRIPIAGSLSVGNHPSGDAQDVAATTAPPVPDQDPQYYTLKSGDNPWKIAKQFHVRFNELLNMNDLDEERARNLQPGDILRVQ